MSKQRIKRLIQQDKRIDAIITTQELFFPEYTLFIIKANHRNAVEEGNIKKAEAYAEKIEEFNIMLDELYSNTPDRNTYKRRIDRILHNVLRFLMPNENERKHLTTQHHNLIIMSVLLILQEDGFYLKGIHPFFEECMDYYISEWKREFAEIGGEDKFKSIQKITKKLIKFLRDEYGFFKYVYELEVA